MTEILLDVIWIRKYTKIQDGYQNQFQLDQIPILNFMFHIWDKSDLIGSGSSVRVIIKPLNLSPFAWFACGNYSDLDTLCPQLLCIEDKILWRHQTPNTLDSIISRILLYYISLEYSGRTSPEYSGQNQPNTLAKPAPNTLAKSAPNTLAKPAPNTLAKPAPNSLAKPAPTILVL